MSRQLKLIDGQWCIIDSESGELTGKKIVNKDNIQPLQDEQEERFCSKVFLSHFIFDMEDRPVYPYRVVHGIGLSKIDFAPITIFYGGNGCGKSTILNIIAENVGVTKMTQGNTNEYFSTYSRKCSHETSTGFPIPEDSEFLRSEDIMDRIVSERKRYSSAKIMAQKQTYLLPDLDGAEKTMMHKLLHDPDELSPHDRFFLSRCNSGMAHAHEASQLCSMFESNGEVAMSRIREMIMPDCLYLLDEPENSLSPIFQKQLARHIETFASGLRTQFIIATHSPFFLSMNGARIYDLDVQPARVREWQELENMKAYFSLFENNRDKFITNPCQTL